MAVLSVVVGLECGGCFLAAIGLMGATLTWGWNMWTMLERRLNQHLEGATPETRWGLLQKLQSPALAPLDSGKEGKVFKVQKAARFHSNQSCNKQCESKETC